MTHLPQKFLTLLTCIILILSPLITFAAEWELKSNDTSRWDTGFCHNFKVKNTSSGPISGWKIRFEMPSAKIVSFWSVHSTEISPGMYEFTGESWNNPAGANTTIDVGFCADGTGLVINPVFITEGTPIPVPTPVPTPVPVPVPTPTPTPLPIPPVSSYQKSFSLTDGFLTANITSTADWDSGYCRNIDIKNSGSESLSWLMNFDLDAPLTGWNAKFIKSSASYTLNPESWTMSISPGNKISFGFCSNGTKRDNNWILRKLNSSIPQPVPIPTPTPIPTPIPSPTPIPTPIPSPTPILIGSGSFGMYAYLPSWAKYIAPSTDSDITHFDMIIHAFIVPAADGGIVVESDFNAKSTVDTAHNAGKKILVSVGGGYNQAIFGNVTASPTKQAKLVKDISTFVLTNGYDGVDVDWEWPNNNTESIAYVRLMHDLRLSLPGKVITVAVPIAPQYHFVDVVALAKEVDFLFVMAYDIEGGWVGIAWHNAPLYRNANMSPDLSIATLIESEYLAKNIPPSKIIMGFPLYGRKFLVSKPYETAYSSETVNYRDLPFASCTRFFDTASQVPWLSCGSYYISYDDSESLQAKINYAQSKKLGGIFMWALGADAGKIVENIPIPLPWTSTLKMTQTVILPNIIPSTPPTIIINTNISVPEQKINLLFEKLSKKYQDPKVVTKKMKSLLNQLQKLQSNPNNTRNKELIDSYITIISARL